MLNPDELSIVFSFLDYSDYRAALVCKEWSHLFNHSQRFSIVVNPPSGLRSIWSYMQPGAWRRVTVRSEPALTKICPVAGSWFTSVQSIKLLDVNFRTDELKTLFESSVRRLTLESFGLCEIDDQIFKPRLDALTMDYTSLSYLSSVCDMSDVKNIYLDFEVDDPDNMDDLFTFNKQIQTVHMKKTKGVLNVDGARIKHLIIYEATFNFMYDKPTTKIDTLTIHSLVTYCVSLTWVFRYLCSLNCSEYRITVTNGQEAFARSWLPRDRLYLTVREN
jgi:hypothetical protein